MSNLSPQGGRRTGAFCASIGLFLGLAPGQTKPCAAQAAGAKPCIQTPVVADPDGAFTRQAVVSSETPLKAVAIKQTHPALIGPEPAQTRRRQSAAALLLDATWRTFGRNRGNPARRQLGSIVLLCVIDGRPQYSQQDRPRDNPFGAIIGHNRGRGCAKGDGGGNDGVHKRLGHVWHLVFSRLGNNQIMSAATLAHPAPATQYRSIVIH